MPSDCNCHRLSVPSCFSTSCRQITCFLFRSLKLSPTTYCVPGSGEEPKSQLSEGARQSFVSMVVKYV